VRNQVTRVLYLSHLNLAARIGNSCLRDCFGRKPVQRFHDSNLFQLIAFPSPVPLLLSFRDIQPLHLPARVPGFPGSEPAPDPAPRLGVDCVRVARGNALLSVAVPVQGSAPRRCSSHRVCRADNSPSYLTAPVHPIDRSFDLSALLSYEKERLADAGA
jgi:hypothetical protein